MISDDGRYYIYELQMLRRDGSIGTRTQRVPRRATRRGAGAPRKEFDDAARVVARQAADAASAYGRAARVHEALQAAGYDYSKAIVRRELLNMDYELLNTRLGTETSARIDDYAREYVDDDADARDSITNIQRRLADEGHRVSPCAIHKRIQHARVEQPHAN